MHILKSIFSAIIFIVLSFNLYSQCPGSPPLSVTITEIIESRCESNGEITIDPTGGTPFTDPSGNPIYDNAIIAGPVLAPIQSSPTFQSLEAGTYTIEVTDANGCTTTISAVVPGTHMTLGLTFEATDVTCLANGSVCGIPADGRPWPAGNYEYELFDDSNPPVSIEPRQIDSCFMNLVAGTYKIRVYDSCNNFQTRDFIIGTKVYGSNLNVGVGSYIINCDTACIVPSPTPPFPPGSSPWGEFPYNWQIVQSGVSGLSGSGVWNSTSDQDTICYSPISPSGNYGIRVEDACGNVITVYQNTPTIPKLTSEAEFTCGTGGEIELNAIPAYICDAGTVTYEVTSVPAGAPTPPNQTTDIFTGLQPGTYCFKVTDCCGYIQTICETISGSGWTVSFSNRNVSCEVGEIGFPIITSGNYTSPSGNSNVYVVISAPPDYPHPLPHDLYDPTSTGVQVLNYVTGPPGNYCWSVRDACGVRDTMCHDFTDTLEFERELWVVPGCVSAHQLKTSYQSNVPISIILERIMPNPTTIVSGSTDTCFNNLSAGSYRVRYRNSNSLICVLSEDTIVVPDYIPPAIDGIWGIQCVNGEGIISAQGSGGIPPYTFELFQGPVTRPLQSSGDFYGLPVGQYDVRIVDSCLNSSITTVSIEPFMPVVKGYGGSFCVGEPASIYVDSISVATYTWSGPNGFTSTNATLNWPAITFADAGTYTVDIDVLQEDQSACVSQTVSVDIIVDCSCSIAVDSLIDVTCNGFANGIATAVSEGIGPYTYIWNTGAVTQVISNLAPGTYAVTITDANGCVSSSDVTITEPIQLTLTTEVFSVSCFGETDGSINACDSTGFGPAGGTLPYSFLWSTGETTCYQDSLSPGTYTLTVTDANGCVATIENTIIEPSPINIVLSSTIESCPGRNATADGCSTTGGTLPYEFFWSNTQTTCLATGIKSGVHVFEVTDANGCHETSQVTVAAEEALCPTSYNYMLGDSIILPTFSSPEETNSALSKIYYLVDSTDTVIAINSDADFTNDVANYNCYRVYPLVYITAEPPVPLPGVGDTYSDLGTVEQSCHSNIALNCNFVCFCVRPACNLSFDTGYSGFGCPGDTVTDITVFNIIGDSCGQGTPVYTFAWNTGATSQNLTAVGAGTYIVTVTDCAGCAVVDTIVIDPPLLSEATGVITNMSCAGNDGAIDLTLMMGDTCRTLTSILWSNGATTEDITGLSAGTYTLTVTSTISNSCAVGPDNCFLIRSFTVLEDCACNLIGSATVVNDITCNGGANGSAAASASLGTPAYSYSWSNGATTDTIIGLSEGTYMVTISDANGCSVTGVVLITEPLEAVCLEVDTFKLGDSIIIRTTGSSDEMDTTQIKNYYLVNQNGDVIAVNTTGDFTNDVQALACYRVYPIVYDSNNPPVPLPIVGDNIHSIGTTTQGCFNYDYCNFFCCICIIESLDCSISATNISCNSGADGTATLLATGGTPSYTYVWQNGATTETITGLSVGMVVATVTDASGCVSTCSIMITEPALLTCTTNSQNVSCFNGNNGFATVIPVGGTAPYSFNWSNGSTLQTNNGLIAGSYTVTVSDANECETTCMVTITQPMLLSCTLSMTDVSCAEGSDGSAISTVTGGTPPYSFAWSSSQNGPIGQTNATATGLTAGNYTLSVVDTNGCLSTCSILVSEPSELQCSTTSTLVSCNGGGDGTANGTASGGTPGYSFLWSNGQSTQTATGLSEGVYNLTVTDMNGCFTICSATVSEPNAIITNTSTTNPTCPQGSDGSATATAAGGTPPFQYNWSSSQNGPIGQQTAMATGLAAGTYIVTVTDSNGCNSTTSVSIVNPIQLLLTNTTTPVSCGLTSDGTATIIATNGTVPYSYNWDTTTGNQTTETATGLSAGTYLATVTDANGCSETTSIAVNTAVPCDLCDAANNGIFDICTVIAADPNHPIATLDCDNGGVDNATECNTGEDPLDPSDDCQSAIDGNINICALINLDPNHPMASLDCDNGGIINIVECTTGEDPSDPADDCIAAVDADIDICTIIGTTGAHPWATLDCDNGGVDNQTECDAGDDPNDPIDDNPCDIDLCKLAVINNIDICIVLASNPNDPLGTLDCDNGGVDNATECNNNGDPLDPNDDCQIAEAAGIDICAIILADPTNPLATQDCDNGGVDNLKECASGEDPFEPSDDCQAAIDEGINICMLINYDPNHPMASLDCDNGGIDNYTECMSGENPSDPVDDCETVIDQNIDICLIIVSDPGHPLASLDCDNGGVPNYLECQHETDPNEPSDDCEAVILCNINVCALIDNDPNHPLANQDCDGGGMSNISECVIGSDPNDAADDCMAAIADSANICAIIANDPNHPMATTDCDNGGIPNLIECLNGEDPSNPDDDCQTAIEIDADICSILVLNPNSALATIDCDNGGINNQTECDNGGDPFDPADDCQVTIAAGEDICSVINSDPNHPMASIDCDNGGIDNYTECENGGDPADPSDDCTVAKAGGIDICMLINFDPNHPLAALDCDNGGIDNYTECVDGAGDPNDPMDDCQSAATADLDLCLIIDNDPTHPWASLDCDNGGIPNLQECMDGGNPSNPSDDTSCPPSICDEASDGTIDICAEILADPTHAASTLDCDGGGITNADECAAGGDPLEPSDDCMIALSAGLDLCTIINGNEAHPLANQDCDGGGVMNLDECLSGETPADPTDDCQAAIDNNINICQLINYDPTHPMATLDCDNGGIDNWTECNNGGNPSVSSDDCATVVSEQIDICTLLTNDPNNPIGSSDCDADGVTNATECLDQTDPLDPCDFVSGSITLPVIADQNTCPKLCPDLTPITTILPGNIAGISSVCVSVEVSELNGITTDSSSIKVTMPSDPRFTFTWDQTLTTCGLLTFDNPDWTYLGNNGIVHTFEYTASSQVITGSNSSAFGYASTYDPQSTDGQTTITATIRPFSGGECNILNNTDSERLVYFE